MHHRRSGLLSPTNMPSCVHRRSRNPRHAASPKPTLQPTDARPSAAHAEPSGEPHRRRRGRRWGIKTSKTRGRAQLIDAPARLRVVLRDEETVRPGTLRVRVVSPVRRTVTHHPVLQMFQRSNVLVFQCLLSATALTDEMLAPSNSTNCQTIRARILRASSSLREFEHHAGQIQGYNKHGWVPRIAKDDRTVLV